MILRVLFFLLLLLLPGAVWAQPVWAQPQPAPALPPPAARPWSKPPTIPAPAKEAASKEKELVDRVTVFINSDPELKAALARMELQAAATPPAAAPVPPPPPSAPPPTVVVAPPQTVEFNLPPELTDAVNNLVVASVARANLPPEIESAINKLLGVLISAAIGSAALWARSHFTNVRMQKDQQASVVLGNAVKNSVGAMQQAGVEGSSKLRVIPIIPGVSPQLAVGVQYVLDNAGPELARFPNISLEDVAGKISAQVGLEEVKTNIAVAASPLPVVPAPLAPLATVPAAVAIVQSAQAPLAAVDAAAVPQQPPPPAQGSIG